MYLPLTPNVRQTMAVVATSRRSEAEALEALAAAVRSVDPGQTLQSPLAMAAYWSRSVARERIVLFVLVGLGALSLLLAALGTYGTLAHAVSRRAHEIGLRMAVGATPGAVRSLVIRSVASMTVAGLAAGLALAIFALPYLEGVLYQTPPLDPPSLVSAAGTLALAAVLAALAPVSRATRTSPVEALRGE